MPRKHKHAGRSAVERYVWLPLYMLQSPAWRSLSPAARAVFIEAAAFYRGDNNGYIGLGVRILAERAGVGRDTVSRCLTELEDKGFIERTYGGTFSRKNRRASEYRLTHYKCDRDHRPASKAFMQWAKFDADKIHKPRGKYHHTLRPSLSDRTVRSQGHAQDNCPSQSDKKARQRSHDVPHGPITRPQLSYHQRWRLRGS